MAIAGAVPEPALAADLQAGVWRGTFRAENNATAKDYKIDTKIALHLGPEGNQIFLENLNRAIPITQTSRNGDGTWHIVAAGDPHVELRRLRFDRTDATGNVYYDLGVGAPLSGQASLDRMEPMSPPSVRPDCGAAPPNLAAFCGAWSGISLRGQPKLLIIDKITRNKQKIAWEIKARQMWGGDSDLASAGMSFPYKEYVTDEQLPLTTLPLRTTGKLAYRFDISGDTITGGHITEPGDRTIYARVKR
jgi:hypothetical protein